jgi:hypothetical protein
MSIHKIYVRLLNEGTNVIRPVEAQELRESVFEILRPKDYDPEDEEWEFKPGAVVRCELETWSGGSRLVAQERIEH